MIKAILLLKNLQEQKGRIYLAALPKIKLWLFLVSLFLVVNANTGFAQHSVIYDFSGTPDGSKPRKGHLYSDGTFLYGVTSEGGSSDMGTLFKIKPDGTGYLILLDFTGANGKYPSGSLISDGTFLYGITTNGGSSDMGTVYKIKPDGTGYMNLFEFAGVANGSYPIGSLILDGTFLYGTTLNGGTSDFGTVFKIMPDGTNYAKLHDFTGVSDGRDPEAGLVSDGTYFYGVTTGGGTSNMGVVFKIMSDGSFSKLFDFTGTATGSIPKGTLITDGTFLYGTAEHGGTSNNGTVFRIMPDGTGYFNLLEFTGGANGLNPVGPLIKNGYFLFGTTPFGGANSGGTIFKIKPDGTSYATLFDFQGTGAYPFGSLISSGSYFYGMTLGGGSKL